MNPSEPSSGPVEVKLKESGPTRELWQGVGTLRLSWTRAGLLHFMVAGPGHGEFAAPIIVRMNAAMRQAKKVTLLIDFWDMPTYDSKLRIQLTEWGRQNYGSIDTVHLTAKSKIVVMGATLANIALDGLITIHTRRKPFDQTAKNLGLPSLKAG